jgi:hypothetical protein
MYIRKESCRIVFLRPLLDLGAKSRLEIIKTLEEIIKIG